MAKYYYAKIGKANSLAECYLSGNNEIGRPAIPIYFDGEPSDKQTFLAGRSAREQGRNFFECGDVQKDKIIIVLHNGIVTIATPIGNVIFTKSQKQKGNTGYIKLLPIVIEHQLSITNVPATEVS